MFNHLKHTIGRESSLIYEEAIALAAESGYSLETSSIEVRTKPNFYAHTGFIDNSTILVELWNGMDPGFFNLVFCHELMHVIQIAQHYPFVRMTEFFDEDSLYFADHFGNVLLDIHADRGLRQRGISTKDLGLVAHHLNESNIVQELNPEIDTLNVPGRFDKALNYLSAYFHFVEDPDIPDEVWSSVDHQYHQVAPMTRLHGIELVEIVIDEGLSDPNSCIRALKRIIKPFSFKYLMEIYGGPPLKPSYTMEFEFSPPGDESQGLHNLYRE